MLQFTVLPYFAEPGILVRVNFVPANKMCTSDQFKEERGLYGLLGVTQATNMEQGRGPALGAGVTIAMEPSA